MRIPYYARPRKPSVAKAGKGGGSGKAGGASKTGNPSGRNPHK